MLLSKIFHYFFTLLQPYMPHQHCYLSDPAILWVHVFSDFIIAFAYYTIPVGLIYFVRKRGDVAFSWMFWMFGAFILLCGTTHVMGIIVQWHGVYKIDGLIKVITAGVSIVTAVLVWHIMPTLLQLPSPEDMRKVNADLEKKLQENRDLLSQLQSSNAELEQFSYVASHDLQEPLRSITSYIQLIQKRYEDILDETGREFMKFVVDGALRMRKLISNLLIYSRITRRPGNLSLTDLNSIFLEVLDDLSTSIKETSSVIQVIGVLPKLKVDPIQIHQVFQNLLINAIKYKRKDVSPSITVKTSQVRDFWVFSIEDNGSGIEDEYFERIFSLFNRVSGRGVDSGNGMGLAICKKIIERHGGKIWVTSKINEGSVFSFSLPLKLGENFEQQ